MVALALDIGQVRIGIAVSDRTGRVAMPVKVLPAAEVASCARSFMRIVEDYEPEVLVCGRPQTLAGEDGAQAERVAEPPFSDVTEDVGYIIVASDIGMINGVGGG